MTREEAISRINNDLEWHKKELSAAYKTALNMAIEALEEPETGKWIGGELGECSVCGYGGCASDIWDRCKEHFCPNCGARLEE